MENNQGTSHFSDFTGEVISNKRPGKMLAGNMRVLVRERNQISAEEFPVSVLVIPRKVAKCRQLKQYVTLNIAQKQDGIISTSLGQRQFIPDNGNDPP